MQLFLSRNELCIVFCISKSPRGKPNEEEMQILLDSYGAVLDGSNKSYTFRSALFTRTCFVSCGGVLIIPLQCAMLLFYLGVSLTYFYFRCIESHIACVSLVFLYLFTQTFMDCKKSDYSCVGGRTSTIIPTSKLQNRDVHLERSRDDNGVHLFKLRRARSLCN